MVCDDLVGNLVKILEFDPRGQLRIEPCKQVLEDRREVGHERREQNHSLVGVCQVASAVQRHDRLSRSRRTPDSGWPGEGSLRELQLIGM